VRLTAEHRVSRGLADMTRSREVGITTTEIDDIDTLLAKSARTIADGERRRWAELADALSEMILEHGSSSPAGTIRFGGDYAL